MTAATAGALLGDIEAAWARTDELFGIVVSDDMLVRPIRLRHPLLFYVGHLPAFSWNMLGERCLGRGAFDAELDALFAFGIDPDDTDDTVQVASWPPLSRTLDYRDRVRAAVLELGARVEEIGKGVMAARARILHLVLEHELMHHETLLYGLQELDFALKRRPASWSRLRTGPARCAPRRLRISGGSVELGADFDALEFGWDNEFPRRAARVESFEIEARPVTVGEFRRFVDEGCYAAEELWTPRAFEWVERHGLEHPKDWERDGDDFRVRALFESVPLRDAGGWPASVSWSEADAYARWVGGRLPTEPELLRASRGTADGGQRDHPWGTAAPGAEHGAFDFRESGPTPVGSYPRGESELGLAETVGNGWEWTSTGWAAHAGFDAYVPGYEGYSAGFFDGAHYAALGASWATDAKLVRPSFRNWYRFNYPYPFTKFRVARDA